MKHQIEHGFKAVLFIHFVPSVLLGLGTISLLPFEVNTTENPLATLRTFRFFLACMLNGVFDALLITGFHLIRNRKIRKKTALHITSLVQARLRTWPEIWTAAGTGFVCGSVSIFFILFPIGLVSMTLAVLCVVYFHLKSFFRDVAVILHPRRVATWREVSQFIFTYLTVLGSFSLINASMDIIHDYMGQAPPFGFGQSASAFIDSLYFTTVVMTTLGFGDFVPKTPDTRLLIAFECLVAYVMFALMVGSITNGVVTEKEAEALNRDADVSAAGGESNE